MRAEKISPSTKTSGGDSAGEVRERDAEAAIFVLMDHGDVVLAHDGLGFGALSIVQAAAVVLAGAASAAVVAVWVCCSLQGFLRSRFGGGVARPSVGPPTSHARGRLCEFPSLCVHGFPQPRSARLASRRYQGSSARRLILGVFPSKVRALREQRLCQPQGCVGSVGRASSLRVSHGASTWLRGRPGEHPLRRKCPAKPYCTHFHGPMTSAAADRYSAAIPAMKATAMMAIQ
jgi:hypothetical protein